MHTSIHASPLECKISMQAGYAACDGCLLHVHVWSTFSGAHIIVHFTYCRQCTCILGHVCLCVQGMSMCIEFAIFSGEIAFVVTCTDACV